MNFFQTILTEGLPVFNLVAIFAFKIIAKQHEAHSLYFLLEIAKFKRLASVRSRSTPSSGKILYKSSLFQ